MAGSNIYLQGWPPDKAKPQPNTNTSIADFLQLNIADKINRHGVCQLSKNNIGSSNTNHIGEEAYFILHSCRWHGSLYEHLRTFQGPNARVVVRIFDFADD